MPSVITLWQCPLGGSNVAVDVLESRPGLLPECWKGEPSTADTSVRHLLIMFPGNPGVVMFYKKFAELLEERGVDTLVMGFAGHSLYEHNENRYFVLQDQLEVADRFCRAVFNASTLGRYRSCNVGGHSIGAFVAMHMTSRIPHIRRAFLLTPTICNMRVSPNGKRNSAFLNALLIHGVCTTVIPLLHRLPESVKEALVRRVQPHLDGCHVDIAKQMARPNMIRNLLMLARSEFEQVASLDAAMLKANQERFVFYFVKKDGWVPLEDVAYIRSHVPQAHAVVLEEDEDVAHAWCLHHNEEVIERGIATFLS